jgi:hypothetical protein
MFFAAAASPLVLPLLSHLKVTFDGDDIDYGSAAEFFIFAT